MEESFLSDFLETMKRMLQEWLEIIVHPLLIADKMGDEQVYGHCQNHYSSQGLKHSLQNF